MAKNYEAMLVFSLKNGEDAVKANFEKFKTLIEKNGTIGNVDEWGTRKLAYAINYESEGYYYVVDFSAEPDFIAELERILGITDGVLRFLTTTK
ncbi:MAG: 30S ribosomal protein S6 [Oscillospiraceae bacterium]|nr:30S ribosomal protein S6 [Candidatus Limimonas coprohippi]MCQ2488346.1 30S ribosomal protein S6 [Clostridia bacterium]